MTTAKVARLQRQIDDDRVTLVSFSMDPQHDTPEILKEYGKKFQADASRRHLVTGDRDAIVSVAAGIGLDEKLGQRAEDMVHSGQLVLIDGDGRVRGYYDSEAAEAVEQLAADAKRLAAGA
jgi:cytochrome oxidase Cu insertion factor (SCO1/SenC/PrrC family)